VRRPRVSCKAQLSSISKRGFELSCLSIFGRRDVHCDRLIACVGATFDGQTSSGSRNISAPARACLIFRGLQRCADDLSTCYPDECIHWRTQLVMMRWGLVPSWHKDPKHLGVSAINAQAESLMEKPMWRRPLQKRRCLVPADAFYEWQKLDAKISSRMHSA